MEKNYYMEKLQEAIRAASKGDWDTVEKIACCDVRIGVDILNCLGYTMPEKLKRSIALYHYIEHGDFYPTIRKHVRGALKARPEDWRKDLPESVRYMDSFTVYHAGAEPLDKVKNALSWTLSRDVAEWFAKRHEITHNLPQHIYKATIAANKVIAFLNERNEYEIIQYRNVKDIEEVPAQGFSEAYREYLREGNHIIVDEGHSQKYQDYFDEMMKKELVAGKCFGIRKCKNRCLDI